jgi:hypothetical protein
MQYESAFCDKIVEEFNKKVKAIKGIDLKNKVHQLIINKILSPFKSKVVKQYDLELDEDTIDLIVEISDDLIKVLTTEIK